MTTKRYKKMLFALTLNKAAPISGARKGQKMTKLLERLDELDKFDLNPNEQMQISRALRTTVEALETLRVAVNDKQPDPGAVMFIHRTIAAAEKEICREEKT